MLGGPIRLEPPLLPDADEAREWAERELAKSVYNDAPTIWDRFLEWLTDLWLRILETNSSLGPVLMPVVVLLVVAVLIGIALLVGGPIRRRRLREGAAGIDLLDDDDRSAKDLRAAADTAAAAGDYATAVLERYRAIVRSLDERAILEDRRGRTAHEAAVAAGARLPDCAADLRHAAQMFDGVCYGDIEPSADDDAWLRAVDQEVGRTKAVRTGDLSAAELVAPR